MATQTVEPVATGTSAAPAFKKPVFWTWAPALLPALAMLVVGRFRMRQPGLGWDENASWIVSQRTPGQIVGVAQNIDGVIAPYYLFLHFWTRIFGDSELALRMPSLLAVAAGVGIAAELGRRLFSPGVGLLAGLMLVAVPHMSRYAQDARAYGLAFLFATLATLLLYRALDRPSWWRWIGYAAVVVLVGWAHIITLLVLAGHAYVVFTRGQWRRWLVVTPVALLPVLPLLYLGATQRGVQLGWIADMSLDEVWKAPGNIFGAGMVGLLLMGRAFRGGWPRRGGVHEGAVGAAAPPILLMAVSFLGSSLWVPRYVLFVVPLICLLAASALKGLRLRAGLALALLAAVSLPANEEFRSPTAHMGADFRGVSDIIEREQQPGDGIVYGVDGTWSLRAGIDYHMRDERPADVLLTVPAAELDSLNAGQCADAATCLASSGRVWFFRQWQDGEPLKDSGAPGDVLRRDYREVEVWKVTKATLVLMERR